jgi:hypothetical protein
MDQLDHFKVYLAFISKNFYDRAKPKRVRNGTLYGCGCGCSGPECIVVFTTLLFSTQLVTEGEIIGQACLLGKSTVDLQRSGKEIVRLLQHPIRFDE